MAKSTKQKGKMTLADIWDNTDASEASNQLPAGEHTVRLNSLEKKESDKGIAAFAEYEAIEGENEGRKLRQMYKLTDADGNKAQGAAYLMRDLALLGYENIKGNKLEKTLKEITEEQPMVVITAKENGQYMNAYLNGLADGDAELGGGDDDEDEDEEDAEIEVGSKVTGTSDKDKEVEGEVTAIKGSVATVEDEDGKKHKCDVSDLELVEDEEEEEEEEEEEDEDEDEEEEEIEVGDTVTDGEITGEVVSIKGDKATVEDEDGKKHKLDLDTLEKGDAEADDDDDDDDDEEEIEVGDTVSFEDDDEEEQEGEVLSIKKNDAVVKVGKKKHTVALDELTKVDDE